MRGRPVKPIEQKIREGNAGKRKLPEPLNLDAEEPGTEVVALVASPPKPADLPPAASMMWDELVPILSKANVLSSVGGAALMALCIQWERSVQARAVLKRQGLFSLGSMGQLVEHPAVQTERAAHLLFLRFAEQFGITPVARTRIAAAVAGASMRDELGAALDLDLDYDVVNHV